MKELFELINDNCKYVVLRNWEDVYNEYVYGSGGDDIDILCEDKALFIKLTGAKRLHGNIFRDNYFVAFGRLKVRFDIRWVGDGYYPTKMERLILENRKQTEEGIFIPDDKEFFYSLSYHALLQKRSLSDKYLFKLQHIFNSTFPNPYVLNEEIILNKLKEYLCDNQIKITIPNDPAVIINWANVKKLGYEKNIMRLISRFWYRFILRINSRLKH